MRRLKLANAYAAAESPPANPRSPGIAHPGVIRRGLAVNDPTCAPSARAADAARLPDRHTTATATGSARRNVQRVKLPAGTRPHERRWRNAPIILVERRKGEFWKYGSIALCLALWLQVWLMFKA